MEYKNIYNNIKNIYTTKKTRKVGIGVKWSANVTGGLLTFVIVIVVEKEDAGMSSIGTGVSILRSFYLIWPEKRWNRSHGRSIRWMGRWEMRGRSEIRSCFDMCDHDYAVIIVMLVNQCNVLLLLLESIIEFYSSHSYIFYWICGIYPRRKIVILN